MPAHIVPLKRPLTLPSPRWRLPPFPTSREPKRNWKELLLEGLNSGEPVEADESLWNRLKEETDTITAEHLARKRHP
jgi:hypothetical protein